MEFPKYNGTVHPDEWLKEVHTQCILNNVKNDKDILKLAKLNVGPAIKLPDDINSLPELTKALKEHQTFNIFKSDCKARLDGMVFEGGDVAQFLADVRALCNNAEIINPDDVRRRLLNTYPTNEFFRNEFANRVTRTTSVDDMFRIYSDIISDGSKIIKYVGGGPAAEDFEFGTEQLITIKHVATGRYLSSIEVNYQTGSQRQVVFGGEKLPNEDAAWYITYETDPQREGYQSDIVLYEDLIVLNHKKTKTTLSLNDYYKSPASGKAEVHCYKFIASNLRPVKIKDSPNKTSYLKMGDTIHIKSEDSKMILSSHGVTFTIEDKVNKGNDKNDRTFQEVVGHREKVGRDDEWRIERYR